MWHWCRRLQFPTLLLVQLQSEKQYTTTLSYGSIVSLKLPVWLWYIYVLKVPCIWIIIFSKESWEADSVKYLLILTPFQRIGKFWNFSNESCKFQRGKFFVKDILLLKVAIAVIKLIDVLSKSFPKYFSQLRKAFMKLQI